MFGQLSRQFASVAVDHFVGFHHPQDGLTDLVDTLGAILPASPDPVTMFVGTARSCWPPYAGKTSLAGSFATDHRASDLLARPDNSLHPGLRRRRLLRVPSSPRGSSPLYGSRGDAAPSTLPSWVLETQFGRASRTRRSR